MQCYYIDIELHPVASRWVYVTWPFYKQAKGTLRRWAMPSPYFQIGATLLIECALNLVRLTLEDGRCHALIRTNTRVHFHHTLHLKCSNVCNKSTEPADERSFWFKRLVCLKIKSSVTQSSQIFTWAFGSRIVTIPQNWFTVFLSGCLFRIWPSDQVWPQRLWKH